MRIASILFLVCSLVSCGEKDFFSDTMTLSSQNWPQKKPALFEVDVTDTLKYYDFWVDFRHNDNYAYSDIYLFMDINFPNGKSSHDTIHYIMQQPDGKWLGTNTGTLIENHFMVKAKTAFPLKGKYKLSLRHAMRDENLEGIEDVGIIITERK